MESVVSINGLCCFEISFEVDECNIDIKADNEIIKLIICADMNTDYAERKKNYYTLILKTIELLKKNNILYKQVDGNTKSYKESKCRRDLNLDSDFAHFVIPCPNPNQQHVSPQLLLKLLPFFEVKNLCSVDATFIIDMKTQIRYWLECSLPPSSSTSSSRYPYVSPNNITIILYEGVDDLVGKLNTGYYIRNTQRTCINKLFENLTSKYLTDDNQRPDGMFSKRSKKNLSGEHCITTKYFKNISRLCKREAMSMFLDMIESYKEICVSKQ